jgi:hypothetical protein
MPLINILIKMLRYFLFSILALFAQDSVYGCSCDCFKTDVPVEEIDGLIIKKKDSPNSSALIFEGILIKSETKGDNFELSFEVQRYYKGKEKATQIKILTSRGNCGFRAKVDSKCLIFAYKHNSFLHAHSSECSRSVAKEQEEAKYTQYKRFLELIIDKPDGTYQFRRLKNNPYACEPRDVLVDDLNLQFKIKNNQLEGEWLLYNFDGAILEKGMYQKGLRSGEWLLGSKKIRFVAIKPD